MVIYRLQCSACGKSIERDLCRMYLQRKTYTQFLKLIQDGRKATGEIIIPLLYHRVRYRRERIQIMPNRTTRKTYNRIDSQHLCRMSGPDHLLGSPLVNPFRIAISPNIIRQDRLMALIDIIANSLSYQMGRDRIKP